MSCQVQNDLSSGLASYQNNNSTKIEYLIETDPFSTQPHSTNIRARKSPRLTTERQQLHNNKQAGKRIAYTHIISKSTQNRLLATSVNRVFLSVFSRRALDASTMQIVTRRHAARAYRRAYLSLV